MRVEVEELAARPPDFPQVVDHGALDRRVWTWSSGPCSALGHGFEVLSESCPTLRPALEQLLTPFQAQRRADVHDSYRVLVRPGQRFPYALYHGARRLTLASRPETLVQTLSSHVNQTTVERCVDTRVVLHGAAVTRAGVTVILPAGQERGKTTALAALLRDGYGYAADDAVALDPDTGCVSPFPTPLSLDPQSWPLFPECRPGWAGVDAPLWQVPAEWLGSHPARGDVPSPRVIVFPEYVPGASTESQQMTTAEVVQAMAHTTFHFRRHCVRNLKTLTRVASAACAVRLRFGSLDDAVLNIESLVSQVLLADM